MRMSPIHIKPKPKYLLNRPDKRNWRTEAKTSTPFLSAKVNLYRERFLFLQTAAKGRFLTWVLHPKAPRKRLYIKIFRGAVFHKIQTQRHPSIEGEAIYDLRCI